MTKKPAFSFSFKGRNSGKMIKALKSLKNYKIIAVDANGNWKEVKQVINDTPVQLTEPYKVKLEIR